VTQAPVRSREAQSAGPRSAGVCGTSSEWRDVSIPFKMLDGWFSHLFV
jgi:hypothetical protein